MSNIVNFIKSLFGFENPDESLIGLSSLRKTKEEYYQPPQKTVQRKEELTLSALLTRRRFQ